MENDNRNRAWDVGSALSALMDTVKRLFSEGNRRRLVVRNASGATLFQLPLTIAVLIGLFLAWRAALLLIVAVVVALVLKVQFVISLDRRPDEPNTNGE